MMPLWRQGSNFRPQASSTAAEEFPGFVTRMHSLLSGSRKSWHAPKQHISSRAIKIEAEQMTPQPGILEVQGEMRDIKAKLLALERAGNGSHYYNSPLEDVVSVLMVKNWSLEDQVQELSHEKQLKFLRQEEEELQTTIDQTTAELVAFRELKQAAEERAAVLEAELGRAKPELEAAVAARAELATKILALQSKNVELTKALKCAESRSVDVMFRKKVVMGAGGSPERSEGLRARVTSLERENETLKKVVEEKQRAVEQGMREVHRVHNERDTLKRVLLAIDAEKTDLEGSVRALTRGLWEGRVVGGINGVQGGATTAQESGQQGGMLEELTEAITWLKYAVAAAEARAKESEGRAEELLGAVLPRLAAVEACSEKPVEDTEKAVAEPLELKGECEEGCERLRGDLEEAMAEMALVKQVSKAMGSALITARAEAQERALVSARLMQHCRSFLPLAQTCLDFVSSPQCVVLGCGACSELVELKQRLWQQLQQLLGGVPSGGAQGRGAAQVVASGGGVPRKRKAGQEALPAAAACGLGGTRQHARQRQLVHGLMGEQGDGANEAGAAQQLRQKRRRTARTEDGLNAAGPGGQ
ncbi:hypothetical protein KFL_002580180 [Klebsormidium nitens]|uniref:Uncharacterized protein n=1 Tax=Klebsormidium nitens TaxID=105231 RepID=A0A1Y1ICR5_KLENI|nr:hypothetical protein KFL_002580180 [Klebsormidium nitens]|eukprot:GAQ85868.1 hypothetical protein KFL_002580180 [Klebsormidium nitens]